MKQADVLVNMRGSYPRSSGVRFSGLLPLVFLAWTAGAQEIAEPEPKSLWHLTLETGAGTLSTRESTEAFVAARVTADGPIGSRMRAMLRGDLDRTQDPDDPRLKSFSSIEAVGQLRYYLYPGWSLALHGGAAYESGWGDTKLSDAKLRTAMLMGCVDVPRPDEGYGCIGGGWRGPVGGWALSATMSRSIKGITETIDFDLPLNQVSSVFRPGGTIKIYTVRIRAIIRIKRF